MRACVRVRVRGGGRDSVCLCVHVCVCLRVYMSVSVFVRASVCLQGSTQKLDCCRISDSRRNTGATF